jgi:hypothetical protein
VQSEQKQRGPVRASQDGVQLPARRQGQGQVLGSGLLRPPHAPAQDLERAKQQQAPSRQPSQAPRPQRRQVLAVWSPWRLLLLFLLLLLPVPFLGGLVTATQTQRCLRERCCPGLQQQEQAPAMLHLLLASAEPLQQALRAAPQRVLQASCRLRDQRGPWRLPLQQLRPSPAPTC